MLEMYLFINPLGAKCYEAEQNILKLAGRSSQKIQIRFIPLLNLQSVSKVMTTWGLKQTDLQLRNKVSDLLYRAILDYEAALFQGRKRGHNFLLSVQHLLYDEHQEYNEETIRKAAELSKLDLSMFEADRHSELAIKSFRKDQKLAAEMQVTMPTEMVIYNLDDFDCALCVRNCDSLAKLEELVFDENTKDFTCSKKILPAKNTK